MTEIYSLGSVQIHGTLYKPDNDSFLNYGSQNGLPNFGRIANIWFIVNYGVFFALHVMVTSHYDENLNAFQVEEPDLPQGFEVIKQEEQCSKLKNIPGCPYFKSWATKAVNLVALMNPWLPGRKTHTFKSSALLKKHPFLSS